MDEELMRQTIARLIGVNPSMSTVTDFIEVMRAIAREEAEAIRKREAGEELREIQDEVVD